MQDPALDLLQASLRRLDDARQTAPARDGAVAVIAELLVAGGALEAPHVGQPRQLTLTQLEAVGQTGDGVDRGQGPVVNEPRTAVPAERAAIEQAKNPRRLRVAGPGRVLGQELLDESDQLAAALDGRGSVDGDDADGQRLHPAWPAIEAPGAALGDRRRLPRSGLEEGICQLGGERGAFVGLVHGCESSRRRAPTAPCRACPQVPPADARLGSRCTGPGNR